MTQPGQDKSKADLDDDAAWDAVLSDPENQKTLAELVKSLKEQAAQGIFGEPELMPKSDEKPVDD